MTTGIISGIVKVATEDGAFASNSIVRAYDRVTGIVLTTTNYSTIKIYHELI